MFAEKACLSLHFSLSLNAAMPVKTRKVAIMGFRAVGKMIVMESISLLFSVQGSLHSLYSLWRIILLTRMIQPLRIVRQILIDMKSLSLSLSAAFQKSVSYKGQDYLINVVDTAGQVRNNLYNL